MASSRINQILIHFGNSYGLFLCLKSNSFSYGSSSIKLSLHRMSCKLIIYKLILCDTLDARMRTPFITSSSNVIWLEQLGSAAFPCVFSLPSHLTINDLLIWLKQFLLSSKDNEVLLKSIISFLNDIWRERNQVAHGGRTPHPQDIIRILSQ